MRQFILLFLFCLPCFANQNIVTPEESRYSTENLQQLVSKKKFRDAVRHLRDIPQSDRNDLWRNIVEVATVGYLEQLERAKNSRLPSLADRFLTEYPFLIDSKGFCAEYNSLALAGFQMCYASSTPRAQCTNALADFFKKHPDRTGLMKPAADLAYQNDPPSKNRGQSAFLNRICPLLQHTGTNDNRCSPKNR